MALQKELHSLGFNDKENLLTLKKWKWLLLQYVALITFFQPFSSPKIAGHWNIIESCLIVNFEKCRLFVIQNKIFKIESLF